MSTLQTSALVSKDWEFTEEPAAMPSSLLVQLRRRAHVLPWFRFVYAEGDNSDVTLVFATHTVTIKGHGLAALLAAISTQRVVRLVQPTENEAKFGFRGSADDKYDGPGITAITVSIPE